MKKFLVFCLSVILLSVYFSHSLAHNISRGYQKLFAVMRYDYEGLYDENSVKELSWKEKIFCLNEYASDEVMAFLRHIEDQEKLSISQNRKRNVEETFFGNKRVIIKSMEFPGFFSNIFRMGMGVNVWNNAHFAYEKKTPVLKPIAFVEKRRWNKSKTFVAYLYEGKVCEKEIQKSEDWFHKIQELTTRLNRECLIHDDLRLKNMVLLEDGTIQLIDIDKIHYYPRNSLIFRSRLNREMRKFNQNLSQNSNTEKRLRIDEFPIINWQPLIDPLMNFYRKLFVITHYEYEGINDPQIQKELSWGNKIFCLREYANEQTFEFLRNIEDSKDKKPLWKNAERTGEEAVIAGKKVIIKSIELDGYFSNLFRMGLAVNIWNNAARAKIDGIPVLTPIALVENRTLFKTKAFVVYLFEGEVCTHKSEDLLKKIKILSNHLREKSISHHDFYIRNILILDDGSLQLIDIDKMHWYPKHSYLFSWKIKQENRRFYENYLARTTKS